MLWLCSVYGGAWCCGYAVCMVVHGAVAMQCVWWCMVLWLCSVYGGAWCCGYAVSMVEHGAVAMQFSCSCNLISILQSYHVLGMRMIWTGVQCQTLQLLCCVSRNSGACVAPCTV